MRSTCAEDICQWVTGEKMKRSSVVCRAESSCRLKPLFRLCVWGQLMLWKCQILPKRCVSCFFLSKLLKHRSISSARSWTTISAELSPLSNKKVKDPYSNMLAFRIFIMEAWRLFIISYTPSNNLEVCYSVSMATYFVRPENDLKIIWKWPEAFQLVHVAVWAKRGSRLEQRRHLPAALILESCILQNGLELKSLGVKIDSSFLPVVVSADILR